MAQMLTFAGTPEAGIAMLAAPLPRTEPDAGVPAPLNPPSQAPSHCGLPMDWAAPARDALPAYSFDAGSGAADLPPVWRCSCGFQLDGIVHTSNALAALS